MSPLLYLHRFFLSDSIWNCGMLHRMTYIWKYSPLEAIHMESNGARMAVDESCMAQYKRNHTGSMHWHIGRVHRALQCAGAWIVIGYTTIYFLLVFMYDPQNLSLNFGGSNLYHVGFITWTENLLTWRTYIKFAAVFLEQFLQSLIKTIKKINRTLLAIIRINNKSKVPIHTRLVICRWH